MRRSIARSTSLGLVVLASVLGACSGDAVSTPTLSAVPTPTATPIPSADATSVTIDDTGCSASGPLSFVAGPIRIEVANDAAALANFELLAFTPDGSFEALATHVVAEQARLEAGEEPLGPPDWVVELTRAEVEPGDEGALSATAEAGTLAVVCALIDPGVGVLAGPYVIGPLEVR